MGSVTNPISFTGVSTFSNDFQQILTRAVGIASLPLHQLQNTESDILQKKTQLASFGDSVTALANSFNSLAAAVSTGSISATSSNTSAVSASASGAITAGTYTINSITSLATPASEVSLSGYADSSTTQVSSTGTVSLVVGGTPHKIVLGAGKNNLLGVRDAINSLGLGVTASIITTGTGANPNYLSVTSNSNGHIPLQLFDDPTGSNTNLLTANTPGTDAVFKLDGITVQRQSNVVSDVVPGLNFILNAPAASPVTLTLASSPQSLSVALSQFVTAYNGVVNQVDGQVGKSAGLLSGDVVVSQTSSLLRQIVSYSGPGSSNPNNVNSLSDLGITFNSAGQASFDSTKPQGFSDTQLNSAFAFIGSASKGLASFGARLQQFTDPVTGFIKTQQDSYDRTDSQLKHQISNLQTRITSMTHATQSRLQAVDALVASLQSQQQVITASIQAVDLALFGRNPSTTA